MNQKETAGIMAILKEAYPTYYRNKTKEELMASVNLWADLFSEDPVDLVAMAVKAFIAADTKGFPPVIGQIKQKLQVLTMETPMTEVEAWGFVNKALQDGYYGAKEQFEKLPPIIQKSIGHADRLKEWAMADIGDLPVISSNFMRSYKAKLATEMERERLPKDIQRQMDALQGGQKALGDGK